jgi:hypothetical protein
MSSSERRFQLFISGRSPNSLLAVANIRRTMQRAIFAAIELETIDVNQRPELAEHARVVRTPTLICYDGSGERRLIGDLSFETELIAFLEGR